MARVVMTPKPVITSVVPADETETVLVSEAVPLLETKGVDTVGQRDGSK